MRTEYGADKGIYSAFDEKRVKIIKRRQEEPSVRSALNEMLEKFQVPSGFLDHWLATKRDYIRRSLDSALRKGRDNDEARIKRAVQKQMGDIEMFLEGAGPYPALPCLASALLLTP